MLGILIGLGIVGVAALVLSGGDDDGDRITLYGKGMQRDADCKNLWVTNQEDFFAWLMANQAAMNNSYYVGGIDGLIIWFLEAIGCPHAKDITLHRPDGSAVSFREGMEELQEYIEGMQ